MTDFDYDCYLKKQVAHSAARRKNGSRSKRCTLPSDTMTEAQKKKLNGRVVTYYMNRPMTWADFKTMPEDLKKQYLDFLVSEFDAGSKQISQMFGIAGGTLTKYIPAGFSFRKAHRMDKSKVEAWERFLAGETPQAEEVPAQPEEPAPAEQELPAEENVTFLNVTLNFKGGEINPDLMADAITVLRCLPGVRIVQTNVNWINKNSDNPWQF